MSEYQTTGENEILTEEQFAIRELTKRVEKLEKEVGELVGSKTVEVEINLLSEEEKKMIVKRLFGLKGENNEQKL